MVVDSNARVVSGTYGRGDAGGVLIEVTDLSLNGGSRIGSVSLQEATGNAGDVTVKAAGKVKIAGKGLDGGISILGSNSMGSGNGGNVTVKTSSLYMGEGAEIQSTTFGTGKGGTITVNADEIHATGGDIFARGTVAIGGKSNARYQSGLLSRTDGEGDAGTITV